MGEFIDFGKFAQTALSLQQVQQGQERLDLTRQSVALDQERLKLAQEQTRQQDFQNYMKLADDPRVRANPDLESQVFALAGQAAGMPALKDPKTLQFGRDRLRTVLEAMSRAHLNTGTPEEQAKNEEAARNGWIELQILAGPQDADRIVKSMGAFGKIREDAENVESMRQLQKARFERIYASLARVNAGQVPYTIASHDFTRVLADVSGPEFQKALKIITEDRTRHEAKDAYTPYDARKGMQLAGAFVGPKVWKYSGGDMQELAGNAIVKSTQYTLQADELKVQLQLAESGHALPDGVTKRDLSEKFAVVSELGQAYDSLGKWAADPFNPATIKAAQGAQEIVEQKRAALEKMKSDTSAEVIALRKEAQSFRESEAGKKHQEEERKRRYEENVMHAQNAVLRKYGYAPTSEQLIEMADKYNVKSSDVLKDLQDPAKRGTMSAELKFGQGYLDDQFKGIEDSLSVITQTRNMLDIIKKNPGTVGGFAEMSAGVAGLLQQARALGGFGLEENSKLNTKDRDELETMFTMLAYAIAKSNDKGSLDVKSVEAAKQAIGEISSFTTGALQVRNKLEKQLAIAEARLRLKRDILRGGAKSMTEDTMPGRWQQAPTTGLMDWLEQQKRGGGR